MLRYSRISGKLDVGRLGAALARPGIDTRVWESLAVARGESVVNPQHGVFVNVTLLPTGEKYTARVPSIYAGAGFGLYSKIHDGDELLVAIPSGNAAEGPVVVSRLWSASDLPPQDAITTPDDVILVVEQDKNLHIKVQGQGQVNIDTDGGNVRVNAASGNVAMVANEVDLGEDAPTDYAALAQLVLSELQKIQNYMVLVDTVLRTAPAVQPPSAPDVLWVALNAAIATNPYPTPASVAATKVKAV